MAVAILILAAGASRRMGGKDKLLQPVAGQPLLAHIAGQAAATGLPVYVTLPAQDHPRALALSELALHIVPVPDANLGMAASIVRGIAALGPGITHVAITTADMPELTRADFALLAETAERAADAPLVQATEPDGAGGHPVVFPRRCFPALLQLTGDSGARPVLAMNEDRLVQVALPRHHATTDLDTPQDWADWHARQP